MRESRRIAIIGSGPSVKDAPWDQPWEFWGCNYLWRLFKVPPSLWFEIHPLSTLVEKEIHALQTSPVDVLMQEKHPNIPTSVIYPAGLTREGPMTCTFCYELSYALSIGGVSEIGLFGVDLDDGTPREETVERQGVLYWVGMALGRGLRVTIPESSGLLRYPFRYGFDYWEEVAEVRRRLRRTRADLNDNVFDDYGVPGLIIPDACREYAKTI